ncbi:response regulator [Cognatishimia sp. 1_MG-2023]|uniref:response regulator n=1 Tax=Cognatishimia sp. 1_MG-2023 TaxID=3062642 RepID=UPI0026E47989|nr:response regulator [Cognatishimia sp. 1_MG-2023]MDO6726047.1 response regulator [Cognatishimia sp. 1_MG-2023]
MDEFSPFTPATTPTARRPLLGLTVLAVEDSRYASDALRLICLKSGARIRRADCLNSARRHLKVYRPTIAIIDLGLPDGSGLDLIRDLNQVSPRVSVILAMSGDTHLAHAARSAGADGFLAKPLTSLAAFQTAVLSQLPADRRPSGPRPMTHDEVSPDPISYVDDLAHAADVLGDSQTDKSIAYVTQFLSGVASSAGDRTLHAATEELIQRRARGDLGRASLQRLAGMVQDRLDNRQAV